MHLSEPRFSRSSGASPLLLSEKSADRAEPSFFASESFFKMHTLSSPFIAFCFPMSEYFEVV